MGGPVVARRMWANQVASSAIRLVQHYMVSLTLMGGLETAVHSIMASVVAYKEQRARVGERRAHPQPHVSNLVKALMGISIVRTVVLRRVDMFSHLSKVKTWVGRLLSFIGRIVSERLVF